MNSTFQKQNAGELELEILQLRIWVSAMPFFLKQKRKEQGNCWSISFILIPGEENHMLPKQLQTHRRQLRNNY